MNQDPIPVLQGEYFMTVPVGDARRQHVRVIFSHEPEDHREEMILLTRCGPATEGRYGWALCENLRLKVGTLAIARIEGEACFVLICRLPRDAVKSDAASELVKRLAEEGDRIEAALTGLDIH